MSVSVVPLDCGQLTAPRSMFEAGANDEPVALPVPAWLIRHPKGLVLFDCGMHAELTAPGPVLDVVSLFFDVDVDRDRLVTAALAARDVGPEDIDLVVLSHLHFDHVGGLAQIPDADVVVQASEWAAGFDPELAAANTMRREDFDLGHRVRTVDGDHDLFGDGRVSCIATPGHTPGHQSLRVRLDAGDVVLCADCAYFEATLAGGPLPPIGHDADEQRRSLDRLRDLRAAGAALVPGHDRAAMAALPAVLT